MMIRHTPFLVLEARAESAHTVAASTSSVTTAAVTTTTTVAATAAAIAISIASAVSIVSKNVQESEAKTRCRKAGAFLLKEGRPNLKVKPPNRTRKAQRKIDLPSITTTVTIAVTTTVAAAITAITTTAVATASAATTAVSAIVARHYDKE